jgi:hypothetical protein
VGDEFDGANWGGGDFKTALVVGLGFAGGVFDFQSYARDGFVLVI